MAAARTASVSPPAKRISLPRTATSLIETLVVLFIIGIMLSLLLPALSGARNKANDAMCLNNMRQVSMALSRSINVTKRFPAPNRWTVEILRWIEEEPLYQDLKTNYDPNARFARPPILYCPMQEVFSSRVPDIGFCHFILTVDRTTRERPEKVWWELHDRPLLSQENEEQPWYIGPEQDIEAQLKMYAKQPGPHMEGKYMSPGGRLVP